ncbi:outer membrane lipoprotein-sorting protein [Desulfoluna spongiiphila]|uniref:outer membrane lipoprotein-sorting protein n=1 Tax=Desulfoluna spongiiphila TaxID=419481 RepID=UPI0012538686|nr:outer membrane lipoprotein-sorting protein [Desulfoluna spongiiphila]VVS94324.1 putative outer membrane lipoprotein-sorting protein [Desulfoluna spongiiphila]
MKRTLLSAWASVLILAAATPAALAGNTAADIIRKTDIAEGYRSAYTEYDQVITTSSGAKRTLGVRAWARENGHRQLAEYLTPADIKGQKILMTDDGDNIWMFNAETRRTRKLGSHMKKKKVMGSDFTYEDQAGGTLSEKYTGIVVGNEAQNGHACFVLELIPTPKGPSYDKIRVWVSSSDFITRRVDYYQNGDATPFKQLVSKNIRHVPCPKSEGCTTKAVAFNTVMTNLEDRTETINRITRIRFGVEIPDPVFNPRQLNK